jgi:hypothetical protein
MMIAVRPTCLATCLLALFGTAVAAPPDAVLISLDKANTLKVEATDLAKVEANPPQRGLLVWADEAGVERWEVIGGKWKRPTPAELVARRKQSGEGTRGSAGDDGGGVAQFALQFAQFTIEGATRGGIEFVTPDKDEVLVDPLPTFRRAPERPRWLFVSPPSPAGSEMLTSENLPTPVEVTFAAGQMKVAFAELKGLPREMARGLAPGAYSLGSHRFTVATPAQRDAALGRVRRMGELAGPASVLALEFGFDQLFEKYPTAALDLVDKAGPKASTPHLDGRCRWLLKTLQLQSKKERGKQLKATAPVDPTGVEEIDNVRALIADAAWDKAQKELEAPGLAAKAADDRRVAGLVAMYRGVIFGDSSAGKEEDARKAFEAAIAALAGAPDDLFRARLNYGNFLLQRANDRFNDRALQMAARVERPMLHVMGNWLTAREQYDKARPLAPPAAVPALDVNSARLYSLLADVVRALAPDPKDGFPEGEKVAGELAKVAGELAKEQAGRGAKGTEEPLLRGIAEQVAALIDFRAGNDAAAREAEERALAAYLDGGLLAGAENVYRMLGLLARRSGKPTAAAEALRNLEIAQIISEALRTRFPPDDNGLARAGFFARKAFVTEMMVELLLEQKMPEEALRQLELAKARGLQDLLASRSARPKQFGDPSGDLLKNWDKNTAAVEYFLGAERSYVFVVGPDGTVTAHPVCDEKGKDVPQTELIADVGRVLRAMEGQAGKMFDRLVAGQGYDNSWENDLARLRRELLPDEALERLRGANVVVVVPQHILHYFPFAALVVEKDPNTTKKKMARPKRLLIDEPFSLVYAPSLSAWSLLRARPAGEIASVRAVGLVQAPGAPPLEGVATDLKNLQEVFKERKITVVTAEKARESAAQKLLDDPGLIFFGTHGINVADRPLDSHLLLLPEAGAPANVPGELTAGNLFARKKPIRAELIIMSCCYSGLGDRSPMPGDDLYGLQRAFIQSGARTVVSGLWDVYDGTAPDLMRGMFEGLEAGQPAALALAETQRRFLKNLRATGKDEPWLHPYFWSVYTAAGDDRTRMQAK